MASINGIASVDICANGVAFTCALSKDFGFVCACVGPQNGVFVYVIGIGTISARVVGRKAKRIKILEYGDDGIKIVVMGVSW